MSKLEIHFSLERKFGKKNSYDEPYSKSSIFKWIIGGIGMIVCMCNKCGHAESDRTFFRVCCVKKNTSITFGH